MRVLPVRSEFGSVAAPFRLADVARRGALALALVFSAQAQQPAQPAPPDPATARTRLQPLPATVMARFLTPLLQLRNPRRPKPLLPSQANPR